MKFKRLTAEDKAAFDRDGFLLVPSFFHREEITRLHDVLRDDALIGNSGSDRIIDSRMRIRSRRYRSGF